MTGWIARVLTATNFLQTVTINYLWKPAIGYFKINHCRYLHLRGGLVFSMLASGTQDRGFEAGRNRRIFLAKKSTACLPSEGK
jgi:hypothetical protein